MLKTATVVLHHRRLVLVVVLLGGLAGLLGGLLPSEKFTSSAILIPEGGTSGPSSGLALAASQFGLSLPIPDQGWGPPVYVELLESRELLEELAVGSWVVEEEGGRTASLTELLEVDAPEPSQLPMRTVLELRDHITVSEDQSLGAVRLSVTTEWPSISLQIAERLLQDVNRFNVESRRTQARAERIFVAQQLTDARSALHQAEEDLKSFLQQNRVIEGSPELQFERDRLQREVTIRQQVFTTLAQSLEEARIREVRDTPVVTLIETPALATVPDSRAVIQKTGIGILAGGAVGMLLAFTLHGVTTARQQQSRQAAEFFEALRNATPKMGQSRGSGA